MNLGRKLLIGIILNFVFTLIELTVGYTSGSLSLVSDAFCNLVDVACLIVSLIALKLSQRAPDKKRTFGYGRITVLAGLLNMVILFIIIISILKQAYYKFFDPGPIEGSTVIIVGLIGIMVNGIVALSLIKDKDNFTIRTALFNLSLDVLASLGALISGIVITLTNQTFIDPLVSITIAIILLVNSFTILSETTDILLEGVPRNLNPHDIESTIKEFEAVKKIENLKVWAISNNETALICSIYVEKEKDEQINGKIKLKLKERFNINHMAIEINNFHEIHMA